MKLKDLTKDQRKTLKERMVDDEMYEAEGRGASYGELAEADEAVSDERLESRYGDVEFVPGDFA